LARAPKTVQGSIFPAEHQSGVFVDDALRRKPIDPRMLLPVVPESLELARQWQPASAQVNEIRPRRPATTLGADPLQGALAKGCGQARPEKTVRQPADLFQGLRRLVDITGYQSPETLRFLQSLGEVLRT
jgi:hypothetical protein